MNDTQDLNSRQLEILQFLSSTESASRAEIEQALSADKGSRVTIIRDLNYLSDQGWLQQTGAGKYVKYNLIAGKELLLPIDLNAYFADNSPLRVNIHRSFNLDLIKRLTHLFSPTELELFKRGRSKLVEKFERTDPTILKRELERFTIELSWKSSQIEGNTYSLLETEELIKNRKEATGHDQSEATMILNHKRAFDTMLQEKETFKEISLLDIRAIHAQLTADLEISSGIRQSGVGITGTDYLPLDNKWQIEDVLGKLLAHVSQAPTVPEKALIFLAMLAYLQPFTDGNKRTSRMVSNAILLANGYFPLSYRSVDEVEYKKALIIFYEQNNIFHLKRIFMEQQQFAIDNYFL